MQDEDAPAGGTRAAGAGDAKKGPHRVLVVLLLPGGISPGDGGRAALKRELAAAGREGQPGSSQEFSGAGTGHPASAGSQQ